MFWNTNEIGIQASCTGTKMAFTFTYERSKYYSDSLQKSIDKKITDIVGGCKETTRYGKLKYYHDWLVNNNTYDAKTATISSDNGTEVYYYCHSGVGCMVKGSGVCESYSKCFKVFCMKEGIPCLFVTSSTHAWNYVKMDDGKWYMVDCAWDDPVSTTNILRWSYFLISNNPNIDKDHTVSSEFTYPATSISNYSVSASSSKQCTSHTWDAGKVTTAATCGAAGVKTYTCTVCGSTKTVTIAATGKHSWNSGKITTAATSTSTGIKTYTCTVCGALKKSNIAIISSVTLYKGLNNTYKLTSKAAASWSITSGSKCASLKGNVLTVKAAGTVKVYDSKSKKTVKIVIKNPTLTVSKTSVTIKKGKTYKLTASTVPAKTITWSSSKTSIATVDQQGKVTAKKKGNCYIYIKANGLTKKVKVTVN